MSSHIETGTGNLANFLKKNISHVFGTVNSPSSVSLVASELWDMDFENLETFGLAYVSDRMKIPFTALMPLTNSVGPDGSSEWKNNYRIMSENLQKLILNLLKIK